MAYITCRDAAFAYEGSTVISGLNFEVGRGDYLCVVGENGSGKSTLMKGMLRLKGTSEGEIFTGDGLCRNEIGYLPQQTAVQRDFPADVREVVLSGRLGARGLRPFYTKEDRAVAAHSMELMGIAELGQRCYRELSGGQQQRVLLARALCATRKLLLLDEPVAGLDPPAAQELYDAVERINREQGTAVIMVSHDIRGAARYASHILHLKNRQIFFGPTGEYLTTREAEYLMRGSQSA